VTGYRLDNLDFKENFDAYRGWDFVKTDDKNSVHYEPHGFELIDQLYEHAHPGYRKEFQDQGKRPYYSVPVLFDEKTQTIVSNESAEIIKMFNSEFNEFAKNPDLELNPQKEKVQQEMERVDSIIYPYINDGVYRMGFARTQVHFFIHFASFYSIVLLHNDYNFSIQYRVYELTFTRYMVIFIRR